MGHASQGHSTLRMTGRNPDLRFDRLMPGYHDRMRDARQAEATPAVRASFLVLVVKTTVFLMLSAVLILGGSSLYGKIVSQAGNTSSTALRQIVIGNDVLELPENMIRFRSQRRSTALERIDLHVHWPDISGYTEENAAAFNSLDDDSPIIFVTIEQRDMSRDMSGRISAIYETFLAGPPVDAGNGLVRRAFASASAYGSEDLYYEAGNPYPFAARCIRETERTITPFCLRDIHVGRDLMLTYRFHKSLLPEWMVMDRAIRQTFSASLRG